MRSLTGVDTIFVLVRSSKGISAEERFQKLMSSPAFSFHKYPKEAMSKIVPITGDVTLPLFGLSDFDLKMVTEKVCVIFHSAANVRFNGSLAEYMRSNVLGSKHLAELSKLMLRLEVLVFVSTAYSNCQLDEIDEVLYPLPHDPDDVLKLHEILDDDSLEKLTPKLLGGRPNSYTYSKAVSEHVIFRGHKPGTTLVILRPAIVTPSVKEPVEGWTDSLIGLGGLTIVISLGIVQTLDFDFDIKPDGCPVDFVANVLISTAWHSHKFQRGQQTIYNVTSSNFRSMTLREVFTLWTEELLKIPSMYSIRPVMKFPKSPPSKLVYKVQWFFYHVVFAFLIDFVLWIVRRPPIMGRVIDKMCRGIEMMKAFGTRDWKFISNNYKKLMLDLNEVDTVEFHCDIRILDERISARNMVKFGRRYLLKESDSTIPLARLKYRM